MSVNIISQHIDTLKTHYYISRSIDDLKFHTFNRALDDLISLKKQAQSIRNDYGDTKSLNYDFGTYKFNILPTSVTGFSVVIANNDVSIALRKSKNKVMPSPVVKVEFRAEFLARKGYIKALEIVNKFISDFILADYKISISEIHLATDIQGYNFTHLDFFKIKTRSRNAQTHEDITDSSKASAFGGVTSFSGFSFGGGDYHLRVYNKTTEINKFKNKAFAKTLLWEHKLNYTPDATVWRIEVQIRRAKLKKLVNSDGSTLDDYSNLLNAIPDLWNRSMTDFRLKDISDNDVFNILRGKRTLKNGTEKIISRNAIYKIFNRADNVKFWDDMKLWNSYNSKQISTAFNMPKSGSFDYVTNSIKSVFSTVAKHYGSLDQETITRAFMEANRENFKKKNISLIEDSMNKQLDWFERTDYLVSNGVLNTLSYKHLEQNISDIVYDSVAPLYDTNFSPEFVNRLDTRRSYGF
ncbi:hypothetical protein [Sulfurimonas sp.]|uniref:hypothetical protein n=1 Tax=Sulfurimonas sp. TaxID=2022749 RepID=UPI00261BFBBA|nr:hypothetical protein [Sulfurimonas sp.]MDD5156866.1 hypothetical protein [Sulfurimonas sp.]